jgi:hypothetical protein
LSAPKFVKELLQNIGQKHKEKVKLSLEAIVLVDDI